MFSSKTNIWSTPQSFFDYYNGLYGFNTDVCANEDNAKCSHFYSESQDGLKQKWGGWYG
jgi:phage N-6-adenine-methyltransferase